MLEENKLNVTKRTLIVAFIYLQQKAVNTDSFPLQLVELFV